MPDTISAKQDIKATTSFALQTQHHMATNKVYIYAGEINFECYEILLLECYCASGKLMLSLFVFFTLPNRDMKTKPAMRL